MPYIREGARYCRTPPWPTVDVPLLLGSRMCVAALSTCGFPLLLEHAVTVQRVGDDEVGDPDRQRPERNAHDQPRGAEPPHLIRHVQWHLHDEAQREQAYPQPCDPGIRLVERPVTAPAAEPSLEMLGGQRSYETPRGTRAPAPVPPSRRAAAQCRRRS